MAPPPMPEDPRDTDQLRLLEVFHYIYMGLQAAGLAFLGLHYFIMRSVFKVMEKAPRSESRVLEKNESGTLPVDGDVVPVETIRSPEVNVKGEEFFAEFAGLFINVALCEIHIALDHRLHIVDVLFQCVEFLAWHRECQL